MLIFPPFFFLNSVPNVVPGYNFIIIIIIIIIKTKALNRHEQFSLCTWTRTNAL